MNDERHLWHLAPMFLSLISSIFFKAHVVCQTIVNALIVIIINLKAFKSLFASQDTKLIP